MTTVQEIEKAILKLSASEFKQLRNWLLELDYQQWDKQLEEDIMSGKLDELANEALADFEAGNYQEIQ